jgi:LmbE family N-acetylglucosaminyl deacetylase
MAQDTSHPDHSAALRAAVAALEAEKQRLIDKFDQRLGVLRNALAAAEKSPDKKKGSRR